MNKILVFILIFSVATIIGDFFPVIRGFEKWVGAYDLLYGLSLSYIISYMFYLVVSVVPNRRNQKHVLPYIEAITKKMIFHCEHIASDLLNDKNAIEKNYSIIEIYKSLSTVKFNTPVPNARISYKTKPQMQMYESIHRAISEINLSSNEIYKHISSIDVELIELVNSICNSTISSNSIVERWPKSNDDFDLTLVNMNEPLSTHYAPSLYEHIINTKKLKMYCEKKFKKTAQDYFLDLHKYFESKNWKKFLKTLKVIYKLDSKDRNALYYEAKYYAKLNKYDEAILKFQIALEIHPNLLYNIITDFRGEDQAEINNHESYIALINNARYKDLLSEQQLEILYNE